MKWYEVVCWGRSLWCFRGLYIICPPVSLVLLGDGI